MLSCAAVRVEGKVVGDVICAECLVCSDASSDKGAHLILGLACHHKVEIINAKHVLHNIFAPPPQQLVIEISPSCIERAIRYRNNSIGIEFQLCLPVDDPLCIVFPKIIPRLQLRLTATGVEKIVDVT